MSLRIPMNQPAGIERIPTPRNSRRTGRERAER